MLGILIIDYIIPLQRDDLGEHTSERTERKKRLHPKARLTLIIQNIWIKIMGDFLYIILYFILEIF